MTLLIIVKATATFLAKIIIGNVCTLAEQIHGNDFEVEKKAENY